MNNITMIAAIGENNEIGKDNKLIWRFHEDMQFFRNQTIDKTIVMGMNTFKSLPKMLPRRKHVVLTRKKDTDLPEEVVIVNSVEELLKYIDNEEEVMIIGGATVYSEMLEYADKLVLTEIKAKCSDADAYFPTFNKEEWNSEVVGENLEEQGIKYKHLVYTRKK